MSETNFAPRKPKGTDVKIGLLVEDQRSGDLRRVIYLDSRVVLLRDETNSTTLMRRDSFESRLGSRYRPSRGDSVAIDDGQYGSLRERLAEYEAMEGRKADHKVAALREAVDVLGGGDGTRPDSDVVADAPDETDDAPEEEFPYGEIRGIGPETAGKLRVQGLVTRGDVRSATDEEILAVSGVGPSNLASIRDFLD